MKKNIRHITVLGDGGWGTTLAYCLAQKKQTITLWGPFKDYIQKMAKNRYNAKFLPGIRLPANIHLTANLKEALEIADLIVYAVPSKYTVATLRNIKKTKANLTGKIFLSATKGVDTQSLLRISELFKKHLGVDNAAVLSGPTIAMEVAKGLPSTAVIACRKISIAKKLQAIFHSPSFRIYANTDVTGVELGGSVKNIIALASGVCDGLGFGSNTKAAILTRGLAEMARLGKACGAKEKTFAGLSGLGDLATTCISPQSRNRSVGEQLGKGKKLRDILSKMDMVAEGVETVKAVYKLSRKKKVSMPITTEVYNILYKNKSPLKAVSDLMTRKTKNE